MLTPRAAAATDIGRVRELNEDSFCTGSRLFAVADGMGGHVAGDVASGIVADLLETVQDRPDLRPEELRTGLALANQRILERIRQSPQYVGMGTTVAGIGLIAFAGSDHWVVFHVGDSRVYRYADDVLSQLTADHSEVADMIRAGLLSAAEGRVHPRRNVVTRALGTDPCPEIDLRVIPPVPGERFVVCSDGLTSEIDDGRILDILRLGLTAAETADRLVAAALDAGGRDNVTVIVVDHLDTDPGDVDDTVPRSGRNPVVAA